MKTLVNGLLLVLLAVSAASAEVLTPHMPFRLSIDLARFRGADDSTASIELYYAIPQGGVTYRSDSAGFTGGIDLTVLVNGKDSLVYGDRWIVPALIKDTAALSRNMNLVGLYQFPLRQGEFTLKVIGRDRNDPSRRDSLQMKFPVRPVTGEKTVLSDLEFATTIRQSKDKTPFYKNTLEVVPNVGGVYAENQPCFYYAEAYNLLVGSDRSDYLVRTAVYDAIGREVENHERPKKRLAESSVLVDQVGVKSMHSGTYVMVVSLLDSAKKTLTSSSRKFYVLNTRLGVDSSMLAASSGVPLAVYASMDESELDEEFRQIRYEASDVERTQFSKLQGAEAKRKFLSDFWRRRPAGFRDEYMQRVGYANQNFGVMGKKGYRTDRGRVYIMYGPPDDYERHPNESDGRPYEIWSYNGIQGGVIFVFVQRNSGGGEYELVHSTHRNELHDDNWQRYVYPNQ
ncbi:MAG TPA: GWxTD domain-containing protein [Bacteroidota bacterium]